MSTFVYSLPGALMVKRYAGESWWKQAKEAHVYSLLTGSRRSATRRRWTR